MKKVRCEIFLVLLKMVRVELYIFLIICLVVFLILGFFDVSEFRIVLENIWDLRNRGFLFVLWLNGLINFFMLISVCLILIMVKCWVRFMRKLFIFDLKVGIDLVNISVLMSCFSSVFFLFFLIIDCFWLVVLKVEILIVLLCFIKFCVWSCIRWGRLFGRLLNLMWSFIWVVMRFKVCFL